MVAGSCGNPGKYVSLFRRAMDRKRSKKFSDLVKSKLELLQTQPNLGHPTVKRNVRRTVIHKRITLTYHVRVRKKEIELVSFWNNWRNPKNFLSH